MDVCSLDLPSELRGCGEEEHCLSTGIDSRTLFNAICLTCASLSDGSTAG